MDFCLLRRSVPSSSTTTTPKVKVKTSSPTVHRHHHHPYQIRSVEVQVRIAAPQTRIYFLTLGTFLVVAFSTRQPLSLTLEILCLDGSRPANARAIRRG